MPRASERESTNFSAPDPLSMMNGLFSRINKPRLLAIAFFLAAFGAAITAFATINDDLVIHLTLIPPSASFEYETPTIQEILEQPESEIDMALAKLVIDKMADPSIDIHQQLKIIDSMVMDVKMMMPPNAASSDKLLTIIKYIYTPGEWNNQIVYSYNLDDPLGKNYKSKQLPTYLSTKKGNCVSMPTLLLIMGDKLGLDMHLVQVPTHLFVRFRASETGQEYNIEATSAGSVSNERFLKEYPITPLAVKNGVYLQNLNKKEAIAVWINQYATYISRKGQVDQGMALADLSLRYDPQSVDAMLIIGSGHYKKLEAFMKKYPKKSMIPPEELKDFEFASSSNIEWFKKAEALGWVEPPKEFETNYLAMIEQIKSDKARTSK